MSLILCCVHELFVSPTTSDPADQVSLIFDQESRGGTPSEPSEQVQDQIQDRIHSGLSARETSDGPFSWARAPVLDSDLLWPPCLHISSVSLC